MLLYIIVLGQKMLERSRSYRLLSRMKYISDLSQTDSALKKHLKSTWHVISAEH